MVFASCGREEFADVSEGIKLNVTVADLGADETATKALIKTGWEDGDRISIYYDANTEKAFDITYDGSTWTGPAAITVPGNASGYVKCLYNDDLKVTSIDNYTFDGTTLTFSIEHWTFLTEIQVVVSGVNYDSNKTYTLACEHFTPLSGYEVGADGITATLGTKGAPATGISNADGVAFVFATADSYGSAVDYVFTFSDGSATMDYTRGDKTLTKDASKIIALKLKSDDYDTYTISATPISFVQAGTAQSYTVTSYKTDSESASTPAPWTTTFSTDGGSTWTATAPSWLTTFTSSGDGSIEATNYSAGAAANDASSVWQGTTTEIGSEQSSARDLSCYDIYGNQTGGTERSAPYNTANCYVVSAPGWYCFPCVYGNAIKGGATNYEAYGYDTSGAAKSSGNYYLGAFLNHNGSAITDPWIKDNSISIAAATLEWQDVQGMISDVSFSNDYVYFKVNADRIGQGNAVIAARETSESGTIAWSWHIWVMDSPSTKLATKAVYPHGSTDPNYMLPMNLGYCEDPVPGRSVQVKFSQTGSSQSATITITQAGGAGLNNPYYQWGRKDPMYPSNGTSSNVIKATIFGGSGALVTAISIANASTIANCIQNPTTYYKDNGNYNWSTTRYDNLWNYNVTSSINTDLTVGKTIYDPCPPGFKVPGRNAFSGFTTTGDEVKSSSQINASNASSLSTDKGHYFYTRSDKSETIFFPASGSRHHKTGAANAVTTNGYYWSAAPNLNGSQHGGRSLFFYTNFVNPANHDVRANGFVVRPVRE